MSKKKKREFDPKAVYVAKVVDKGPRGGRRVRWWAIRGDGEHRVQSNTLVGAVRYVQQQQPSRVTKLVRFEGAMGLAEAAATWTDIHFEALGERG